MRIISWNIRAGGGTRIAAIEAQLREWQPDVLCLCEFRGSPPSALLARGLADSGLIHQHTTADPSLPTGNALLIASRWPLARRTLRNAPVEPRRWLATAVAAPDRTFTIAAVHAPNMVTGRKMPFLESIASVARNWRLGPGLILGDTNCGWPGIDEERPVFNRATEDWLNGLESLGWKDAFRHIQREERFFTWYSPNGGNGFRLDQAFVHKSMLAHVTAAGYRWGALPGSERRDVLSDHAALIVDLDWPSGGKG